MTLEQIFYRVEAIQRMQSEPRIMAQCERNLWQSVLEAIAGGADNPHLLAMAALHTLNPASAPLPAPQNPQHR